MEKSLEQWKKEFDVASDIFKNRALAVIALKKIGIDTQVGEEDAKELNDLVKEFIDSDDVFKFEHEIHAYIKQLRDDIRNQLLYAELH